MRINFHIVLLATFLLSLISRALFPVKGQETESAMHGYPVPEGNLAREGDSERVADSLRALELFTAARESYRAGQSTQALNTLGEALQLAMQQKMEKVEAGVLELIGDIYLRERDAEEAIPYYLRVTSMMEFAGDSTGMENIYMKTGEAYSAVESYGKAHEYYLKALKFTAGADGRTKPELTAKLGATSLLAGKAKEALNYFVQYEKMQVAKGEKPVKAWTRLVNACRETGNYEGCLAYSRKLMEHFENEGDLTEVVLLQNNMGHYLTELNRYQEALEYYAMAVDQAEESGFPESRVAAIRANMGVCYQNMNSPEDAKDHLNRALDELKRGGDPSEQSRIEHIEALIYLNEQDLYNAGFFCREAISSAEQADDPQMLSDAYLTYSRVLRKGNDPVNALKYYEAYLAIRDSLQLEEKLKQQRLEESIARLERLENDLLLRLQQERVNELAINRLTLQLEREEQARELLQKESDLRLLEKERMRQSMVITEQQHRVEQQERENRILEQEQRIARLALEKEQQKQRESEQEIRLLEQQQRLDQLSLEKQKQQRKALVGIVVLMVLVMIVVTGSLLLTRKKNMLLARQKHEIEEKNLDLEQKNEEIEAQRDEIEAQRDELEAQRDLLYEQKEAIEQYNVEVTKSIEYAKRIQTATLPDLEILREVVADYFVLFRPRDIVSGDFYWSARVEEITVLVVADCTGHGVPGAFMSVMGMSLLKEIVQKEYLTHPGVILRRMRKEIIRSLGQKGVSGEQRDGMDISLIEISHTEKQLQFAGAYNPLYLVRSSNRKAPDIPGMKSMEGEENGFTLYEIPADRMPVAFFDRMDKFTTHELSIEEGDRLYMFTDGYADQFGGEKGKKFKYIPFKRLILASAVLQMEEQNQVLARTLDEWKGSYDQIDDICMIGLRF